MASILTNRKIEYREDYEHRILCNYNPETGEYFYLRFIGYIQKYLHLVVFQKNEFCVYYVRPDYEETSENPYRAIGKTSVLNKEPVCADPLGELKKALAGANERARLLARDFLSGPLEKIHPSILAAGFPSQTSYE